MREQVLRGVDGSNPLGFLAALGLLRVATRPDRFCRLHFLEGSFVAVVTGDLDIPEFVTHDADHAAEETIWRLAYAKKTAGGIRQVADLKPPPPEFRAFAIQAIEAWLSGEQDGAAYAAAYATDVAVDGNGNTKPTAFHFTAANQEFLEIVEKSRASVTEEWVRSSLFDGGGGRPGSNLRWDPLSDRNHALMARDPQRARTTVDAPLEWLAFRGLPLLPTFPRGAGSRGPRILTSCVTGRGDEMAFTWPVWSIPSSLGTVRSVLQCSWTDARERASRGIFVLCRAEIRRSSEGFGNFTPGFVTL